MHNIQLVKIQPEERLAASSELNPASCLVTGCGEARGMGYWAATQVKGLSPEIFIVPEADVVVLTEGSTLIADSPIGTWQGDASPAGSETVARYQTDIMGTRETQSVLLTGVCAIKPINGKIAQTTLWESDQFIVPEKRGNACRGKGLAGARWPGRDTPSILRDGQGVSTKLWSITLRERRGCTPEEPDEGNLQVRFCEGAHSNLGAITSKKRCAMGSTRQALFYVQKTIQNNWSRSVLTHHIESNLFKREGKAITNFKATLPEPQSDLARETLKDVHKPIGVSEYIITRNLPDEFRSSLPSIEEIEVELGGVEESQ